MTSAWRRWIRRPRSRPRAEHLLVCFPPGGAGASRFRAWADDLDPSVELLAVQYPGREDRDGQPFAASIDEIVDGVADALGALRGHPYAVFGHSMGATVAHAVARRAVGDSGPGPGHLFVSACAPPGSPLAPEHESIKRRLQRWGELDPSLLDCAPLRERVVRTLEADLEILRRHRHPDDAGPLNVPISALGGRDDPEVRPRDVRGWAEHTTAQFDCRIFDGGHGYLSARHRDVLTHVARRLGVPVPESDLSAP